MKALAVAGTLPCSWSVAAFWCTACRWLHHAVESLVQAMPGAGAVAGFLVPLLADALVGVAAGIVVLAGVMRGAAGRVALLRRSH
jgi:predicted DNA repair protein MutK